MEKQNQENLKLLSLVPIDVQEKKFQTLMLIYEKAMIQAKEELEGFKASLKEIYNYDVISNIESRIKTPDSIVKKMKKKNYDLNYEELIKNINDVAGIRIVCPFKTDIFKIKEVIEKNSNLEILEVKDYVNTPKKSGYSGLHIIAQTPVNIGDTVAQVKVEIQIRTMAMDFWSTTEHKIKYKAKNIVLDPVMVATSGSRLLEENAANTLMDKLFPLADIITPNIPELEVISGRQIESTDDIIEASKAVYDKYGCPVLSKGGHFTDTACVCDYLWDGKQIITFETKRVDNPNSHGTGCTLSSAIAANLAKGFTLDEAIRRAKEYISGALSAMLDLGKGSGPMDHAFDIHSRFMEEA